MSGKEKNKLTIIEIKEIFNLRKSFNSSHRIAKIFGCDHATILYYWKHESYEAYCQRKHFLNPRKDVHKFQKPSERALIIENGKGYYTERAVVNPVNNQVLLPPTRIAAGKSYKMYLAEAKQREKKSPL